MTPGATTRAKRVGPAVLAIVAAAVLVPDAEARSEPKARALRTTLPLVVIDAPRRIPAEPKVAARMRVVARAGRRRNHLRARPTHYAGRIGIERRGVSSDRFPKSSYTFETRKRSGEARNVRLPGLPRENDWILYAAYNDKSLMRNSLAYRTSRLIGRYAARTRHVELILNGRYQGVYVLMEKLKLDRARVRGDNLLELTAPELAERKAPVFRTPVTNLPIAYVDPELDDLSDSEAAALRERVGRVESALYGGPGGAPAPGYEQLLDVDAAVDYVLLSELFKDGHAFRNSTYMHEGRDGRLALGPIWDFDVSTGNAPWPEVESPDGFALAWPVRPWAERLYADPAFMARLAARWRAVRAGGLVERVLSEIDKTAARLRHAQRRNFRRWRILGRLVWPNPVDPATGKPLTTYAAEVAHLRDWLGRRAAWLDATFGGG